MTADSTTAPVSTAGAKPRSQTGSMIVFAVMILLIMVCAIGINIVLDGPIAMWVMTIFGAIVISLIIAGAALHSMREG